MHATQKSAQFLLEPCLYLVPELDQLTAQHIKAPAIPVHLGQVAISNYILGFLLFGTFLIPQDK